MATARATPEDVKRLAALARIEIPEEKLESFVKEFGSILAYVGKLEELTIPLQADRAVPAVCNVLRSDGEPHTPGVYTDRIVAQFPERKGDSLSVKQIVTHD